MIRPPTNREADAGLQPDAGSENHLAAGLAQQVTEQLTMDFTAQPGVDRAIENADSWWLDCAWRAVREMADRGVEFEAADLVDLGVPEPDHPNRWGALMRAAHTKHVIKPVGYKRSRRAARAGGVTRTWRGVA